VTQPWVCIVPGSRHPWPPDSSHIDASRVPNEPYALDHLTVLAVVSSIATAVTVLRAVLRGASATVQIRLPPSEASWFTDQLERVADVTIEAARPIDTEQTALLGLLGKGMTLGAAAAQLGMSRRTADRRLAAARNSLAAKSTAEAVSIYSRFTHSTTRP
jgi:DNA-binding NarL/FixJ family response regulator